MSFNQNANVPTQNGGATIAQIPPPPAAAARGGGRNDQTMLTSPPPSVPSSQQQQKQHQYSTMMNQGNLIYSQPQPFANQPYYDPYQQQWQQQQQQRQHQVMQSNPNPNSYAWSSNTGGGGGGGGQQQQYAGNYHQRHYQYGNPPPSYPQQSVMTHNYPQQMAPGRASMNSYSMSMPTRKKVTLKLVILGNSGVGKTSLMNRYHSNKFTGQYKATIGADFVSKQLILPTNGSGTGSSAQTITLTIWDTAGQERFQSLGKAFYRGSDVCVLVYDVTDRMSFDGLQKWKDEFDSCLNGGSVNAAVPGGGGMMQNRLHNGTVVGDKLKFVVVANKADKDYQSWSVTREEGMHFAKSISSEFFECSAKTGLNVEQAFVSAAKAGMDYNMRKQLSMNASMMMQGSQGGMRGYMPPQRTVDLNRGQSSMSDEGDCC